MPDLRLVRAVVLGFLALLTAGLCPATPIVFQGHFNYDDGLQEFLIEVSGPGTFTMQTYSYAGATVNGTPIPGNGFRPVLALFDELGTLINLNAGDGLSLDASFAFQAGGGGRYFLALTQYPNFPLGNRWDGYQFQGQGNFTGPLFRGDPGSFIDQDSTQHTGLWAIGIDFTPEGPDSELDARAIPEPAPMVPAAIGLIMLLPFRRLVARRNA